MVRDSVPDYDWSLVIAPVGVALLAWAGLLVARGHPNEAVVAAVFGVFTALRGLPSIVDAARSTTPVSAGEDAVTR